jgi:hypothetical protein
MFLKNQKKIKNVNVWYSLFFRITQYNANAHNMHETRTPMNTHKPYLYEHLRMTEHQPMTPRRRRERRLPLNA